MNRFICTIGCIILLSVSLLGQEQASLKQRLGALTVEDVVALVEADIGDDLVIEKLRQNATPFDLSVDQLLELKRAGVSSEVIKTMMNPGIGPSASVTNASGVARDPRWPAEIPDELGVYTKINGKTTYIEPEVVTWKRRGKLVGFATQGLAGRHQNGVVNGRASPYHVSVPLEVFIVVREGESANAYRCVTMRQKEKHREFRFETTGLIKEGSADKNIVDFRAERLASRLYRVELTQLEPGQYGFVPPGAALQGNQGAAGRIYSFVVE